MMRYEKAIAYLDSFTNSEHVVSAGVANRFDLGRVRALLALLGHPEAHFASVHVVGTKGKGSTAAMIASGLQAAGLRVGLYTSPHLHTLRERIRIDGRLIPEQYVAATLAALRPLIDLTHAEHADLGRLTTFEVLTVLALAYFARERVDYAVLEAGLGGRLDATNVIMPKVTVIAPIGLDHTAYLGDTIAAITREKAAVIKPGGLVVSAAQRPEARAVIEDCAARAGVTLKFVGEEWQWQPAGSRQMIDVRGPAVEYPGITVPLLGTHQLENATLAVAALDALRMTGARITAEAIRAGIGGVRWPGRLEVLGERPLAVADGAHNPDAMRRLREALDSLFPGKRAILVLGSSADKDLPGIVAEIVPAAAHVIVTRSRHPRSASPGQLAPLVSACDVPVEAAPSVAEAISRVRALASADDLICITGSLFVVAEAREAILGAAAFEVAE